MASSIASVPSTGVPSNRRAFNRRALSRWLRARLCSLAGGLRVGLRVSRVRHKLSRYP